MTTTHMKINQRAAPKGPLPIAKLRDYPPRVAVEWRHEEPMTIHIAIEEPLAKKVEEAAKSLATSPERYVLDAVTKTLAGNGESFHDAPGDEPVNPLLGLLADDPELADFIAETSAQLRTLPMRAPRE